MARMIFTYTLLRLGLIMIALLLYPAAWQSAVAAEPLIVATKDTPPFVMFSDPAARPVGPTVMMVESIGTILGRPIEWRSMTLNQMLEGVAKGQVDMAAGAISVTAERERIIDFSHPYFFTGLGIAVLNHPSGGWTMIGAIMSREFLEAIGSLVLLLAIIGCLIWLFERKANQEQFGGSPLYGIGNGVWWSAVTMSTVGYGDKSPRSAGGRVLGIIWMFASVILISSFTATITSGLTVRQLEGNITGPGDLPRVRVATVPNTTAASYADEHRIAYVSYRDLPTAIEGLARGEADALVYDAPLLKYLSAQRPTHDIKVLDTIFQRQSYAIALPPASSLRKPVNEALLSTLTKPAWQKELDNWL